MNHRSRVGTLSPLLGLLVAACSGGSGSSVGPDDTGDRVVNAGLATGEVQSGSGFLAFSVFEPDQGRDLNGDGDQSDAVLHVHDSHARTTRNLGLAISTYAAGPRAVGLVVFEGAKGQDLNGDGDQSDGVAFAYDVATDTVVNLGVAATPLLSVEGELMLLHCSERANGDTDLNGDGDLDDWVFQVYDFARGVLLNTGLAGGVGMGLVGEGAALLAVFEGWHGADLNGDGDLRDSVAHLFLPDLGSSTNLGLPVGGDLRAALGAGMAAFAVREVDHDAQDLNGDGDVFDLVPFVVDLASGEVFNTERETRRPDFEMLPGRVVFSGRLFPAPPLHVFELATRTSVDTGLRGQLLGADPRHAVVALEEEQEGRDLNGDGDQVDFVPHVYELLGGAVTNLAVAADSGPFFDSSGAVFTVLEFFQGEDLNGDGDLFDAVVMRYDLAGRVLESLGVVGTHLGTLGGRVHALALAEADRGLDLNQDGDLDDHVLSLYDVVQDELRNVGVDAHVLDFGRVNAFDCNLPFLVLEVRDGNRDLNGDGDVSDSVLFVVRPAAVCDATTQ